MPWGPRQVLIGGFVTLLLYLGTSIVSVLLIYSNLGEDVRATDAGDVFERSVIVAEYADERLQAATEGVDLPEPPVLLADVEALKIAIGATLVYQALVLAVVGATTRLSFGGLWRALGLNDYDWRGIWRPVGACFLSYAAIIAYGQAMLFWGPEELIPQSTVPIAVLRDDSLLWLTAIVAVAGAPIAEEFLFRGLIFGGLLKWGFWPAAAISSALFTTVHFDVGSLLPFFCVGVVMCWLFWRERNLWDSIFFHVLFNATSTVALFASR